MVYLALFLSALVHVGSFVGSGMIASVAGEMTSLLAMLAVVTSLREDRSLMLDMDDA